MRLDGLLENASNTEMQNAKCEMQNAKGRMQENRRVNVPLAVPNSTSTLHFAF
jgi:hypothetical protein